MAIITGDDLDNDLTGTAEADVIHGLGGDDQLFGDTGDDQLFGDDGDDLLAAGAGRDELSGGAGDDSIFISVLGGAGDGDLVDGGAGVDFLYLQFDDRFTAPITLSIADPGIEQVLPNGTRITSIEILQFRAGAGDDILTGGYLADVILGGAGTDSVWGRGGNDDLYGLAGNDLVEGGAGLDYLYGGDGSDRLFGGADADLLYGGTGDDLLHGGDGNDVLYGQEGFDILYGEAGDDRLHGWTGPVELHGDTGDDLYLLTRFGQVVVEAAGEGIDTVSASQSYRLPDNVENLFIFGGLRGVGNALDNVITADDWGGSLAGAAGDDTLHGGAGSDWLDGGLGADTMDGGAGNDTYVVGSAGDRVIELAEPGTDTVRSAIDYRLGDNVENLVLIGSQAVDATGNDLANALTGNDVVNTLAGGLGKDVLTGGGGADSFVFDTAFGGSNIDRITDFTPGEDHFLLDPAIFTRLPTGALSPDAFTLGTAAGEADDRILYDIDTGTLRYDRDGIGPGAARAFAIVEPGTALAASDFLIG
ncbi:calcium-binding protein [Inquilinus sp. CA228]|uniref:calcium-binding protein n=1 Tax=Inquilinus sp. CA228 TaxID=3455609 RepID=UPI003F8D5624